jgi:hypothetical protein
MFATLYVLSYPSVDLTDKQGDGVCDTTHGAGINAAHLVYPRDSGTQNLGTNFITAALNSGTGSGSTPAPAPAPSGTSSE